MLPKKEKQEKAASQKKKEKKEPKSKASLNFDEPQIAESIIEPFSTTEMIAAEVTDKQTQSVEECPQRSEVEDQNEETETPNDLIILPNVEEEENDAQDPCSHFGLESMQTEIITSATTEVQDTVAKVLMKIEEDENHQDDSPIVEEAATVRGTIPKRIFQTHTSLNFVKQRQELVAGTRSWRRFVPEYEYYFFNDIMCDHFMKNEMVPLFGELIYAVYKQFPLNIMRADLWRYCVIYKHGGIYADVDTICKTNPSIFTDLNSQLVCTTESGGNNYLCQWVFAAPPESPVLKSIIELIMMRAAQTPISKVKQNYVHYYTGPHVFSDGVENYLKQHTGLQTFPNNRQQYPIYKNEELYCFDSEPFHELNVYHLFSGSDPVDGWKRKRDAQLNMMNPRPNPQADRFFSFQSL